MTDAFLAFNHARIVCIQCFDLLRERHAVASAVSVRSTAPELAAMADPQRLDGGRASGHAHTAPA